jgi:Mg-chelatase subunit ChlI
MPLIRRIGGVLIRGERAQQSTAARGLAAVLPDEESDAECRFGCDPDDELHWCTECKERKAKGIPMTRIVGRHRSLIYRYQQPKTAWLELWISKKALKNAKKV